MSEENVQKLIEMVKEKAYIPGDRIGVSDKKVVRLDDVLEIIEELKINQKGLW